MKLKNESIWDYVCKIFKEEAERNKKREEVKVINNK